VLTTPLSRLRTGSTLPLAVGRATAFAASFFLPVVLARIFTPEVFGTYKQVFLLQATLYGIAQIGMAESLFYFVPADGVRGGRFAANALVALGLSGLLTAGALFLAAPLLAYWFENPALTHHLPVLAVALWLFLVSAPLEIVLTTRQRYLRAAAAYGASNVIKAILLLVPALVTGQLRWLMAGAVAYGALRLVATVTVLRREFGRGLAPDRSILSEQLRYVSPFAAYGLVEVVQANVHQLAVSAWTDPTTFAVYAVGCLNVPLVELVTAPASHVMMVGLREAEANDATDRGLSLWRDTTLRVATIVVPCVALLLVLAHPLIVLFFTDLYAASVPVFRIMMLVLLLAVLQTDGVLRSRAEMRFLLLLGLFKLAVVVATIRPLMGALGLTGAALSMLLATAASKAIAIIRMRRAFDGSFRRLVPWRGLAVIGAASLTASALAWAVERAVPGPPLVSLAASTVVFISAYLLFVAGARPARRERSCAASPVS
jgi:O-antigen/teichoic acid export membrane protein